VEQLDRMNGMLAELREMASRRRGAPEAETGEPPEKHAA
jgi:hypothetical protein